MSQSRTSIHTGDGAIKATPGTVIWVTVSIGATGGAWSLEDGTDDSGTPMISGTGVNFTSHHYFGEPDKGGIHFETGIFADIGGTNVTMTVGYN